MVLYRLGLLLGAVVVLAGEGAAQLPPAVQIDLFLVEAERHTATGDYAAAKAALDRVLALQAAHDVTLPEAFWFKHAQVARQAGLYAEAIESVTRYLTTAGREGAHYRAALELLDRARIEGEEAARRRAAEQQRAEEVGRVLAAMEFVLIEAGTFAMGSPATEEGRDSDEGPVHQVTLSQPFSLGKYEVTQGQWAAVMGHNPSRFSACGPTCPVEQVSWRDAQAFIAELNRWGDGATYRLPTEAEWEYAARAGTQTAIYTGGLTLRGRHHAPALDPIAWYGGNSGVSYAGGVDCSEWSEKQYASSRCGPHPVGQKQPNRWGLYDMLGNVWEWTADQYEEYSSGSVTDPRSSSTGSSSLALRGGSWRAFASRCRVADRAFGHPVQSSAGYIGFRLARDP